VNPENGRVHLIYDVTLRMGIGGCADGSPDNWPLALLEAVPVDHHVPGIFGEELKRLEAGPGLQTDKLNATGVLDDFFDDVCIVDGTQGLDVGIIGLGSLRV
jgi:hypothetical protein